MTYYLLSNRQKNRNARCLILRVACLAGMLILSIGAGAQHKLCNPGATEEARKVYQVLWDVYGKQALSATVANVDWNIKEAENVYEWTGKWPVMNVFDFINFRSSKDVNPNGWLDYSDISTVESWWKQGGLVGCMWHWNMTANDGTSQTCTPGSEPGQTSFDISRIDDTNSDEYKQVIKDIDQIAKYLGKMQEAGIPVIWRPLHEAAGNTYEYEGGQAWFWWGAKGAGPFKKLWRLMYDRLVNHHKLNNLIWVWTSQAGFDDLCNAYVADSAWYPGDEYVDVVARDNYDALEYPLKKEYDALSAKYPGKIVALAECGNGDEVKMAPWSEIWNEGSRWCWFMTWYDYSYNAGQSQEHKFAGKEWWTDAFNSGTVIDRAAFKPMLDKTYKYVLTKNNKVL